MTRYRLDNILEDPNQPYPVRPLENPEHRANWYCYPLHVRLGLLADAWKLVANGFRKLSMAPKKLKAKK